MERLKPYPAYRDSGIPWLGKIPKHWEVKRLKYFAPISEDKLDGKPDNMTYLGLENVESKTGQLLLDAPVEEVDSVVSAFHTDEVLFGKLRPYLAKVVHADFDGVCTSELVVLQPDRQKVEPRFLFYRLLSNEFIRYANAFSYGVKMPRTSPELIANTEVPLPPLDEQRAMANFLDRETEQLDALVTKKEQLIVLLLERRSALISHTVTKGLNPDAPMRDSGIAWLGKVPKHWAVAPVYARYRVQLGKMLDEKQITGEHLAPYLRNVDVQWGRINVDELPEMDFRPEDRERYQLKVGDLLVCEGGEVGRSAIWKGELPECYYQKAIHRLRPFKTNNVPQFLFYVLFTVAGMGVFVAGGNPNTIDHLTAEKLRAYRFGFPPKDEQQTIADYLDRETGKIDALIARVRYGIAALREYRTALISAVVSGKIAVDAKDGH